jgi:hypothetical protein
MNRNQARDLLDPGCEAELVFSTSSATSCGIHSYVDEEILVELPDGTTGEWVLGGVRASARGGCRINLLRLCDRCSTCRQLDLILH